VQPSCRSHAHCDRREIDVNYFFRSAEETVVAHSARNRAFAGALYRGRRRGVPGYALSTLTAQPLTFVFCSSKIRRIAPRSRVGSVDGRISAFGGDLASAC
jgi:hypothetical protein